ncbi:S8 family peptidase [Pararhizobium gei]|uniref:S8 family peptidase n=1 Tax=Pararhizobium gei TaxID=1395951 RepID=UPI0023DC2A3C|nr:S8 family serine peptidase [Rhizobium gei]
MANEILPNPVLENQRPRPTGSLIVAFRDDVERKDAVRSLEKQTDSDIVASTLSTANLSGLATAQSVIFIEDLHVAFIPQPVNARNSTMMQTLAADETVVEIRPEFYLFKQQEFVDTNASSWGVAATHALDSPFTGKGIKICILDTGIDRNHPDFINRSIIDKSFVANENIEDLQGHGTHCAGTACGHPAKKDMLRFGVAPGADLYVGKVLNNRGFGAESDILRGMRWAIDNRCEVISMSLGGAVREGELPSVLYERIGQQALDNGCLIIAAAGNNSNRSFGFIAPVSSPANAASIMAVGAIDPNFALGYFSCGGINPNGGEIDIVAPGVGIFSTAPAPQLYRTMSGTSMACPHAAGIAALWAESDPALRGMELWRALKKNTRSLAHPPRDVGAGLVLAPHQAAANIV